jgi:hypothetical protein
VQPLWPAVPPWCRSPARGVSGALENVTEGCRAGCWRNGALYKDAELPLQLKFCTSTNYNETARHHCLSLQSVFKKSPGTLHFEATLHSPFLAPLCQSM